MKKRVVAIITALMMFMPMASYADTEEFMDGAITLDVAEDWECYESNTSTHYETGEYSDIHIFTAFRDKTVFNMMCIVDDDCYMEDATDYSYEDQKDRYINGGKAMLKTLIEGVAGSYDCSLQVVGDVESEYTDYLKIKVKFDDEAYHNAYVYFAESYEGLQEVFVLKPFDLKDDKLSEGDIRDAEDMIASIKNAGLDSEFFFDDEDYDYYDYDDDEYYDEDDYDYEYESSGDIGPVIAIISLILTAIILVAADVSKKEEEQEEDKRILVEEIVEKIRKSDEEPERIPVEETDHETCNEPEETVYQSSAGYEESIKSLLESGLITKKEYKELLKKHGK